MSYGHSANGGCQKKTGPTEAAVVHTLEQFPVRAREPRTDATRRAQNICSGGSAFASSATPMTVPAMGTHGTSRLRATDAAAALPSAPGESLPPLCSPTPQAALEARVNAEVAQRLYELLNAQLRARQEDLALATQQQQALERAEAAARLGRPTRSPTPPPAPAQTVNRQSGRRSGRGAVPRVGVSMSAGNGTSSAGEALSYLTVQPLAVASADATGRFDAAHGNDDGPVAVESTADACTATESRDRVGRYRLQDGPALNGMSLVRVKRLQAIPNHNRGLFAGLDGSPLTTRSGRYVVGRAHEDHRRVRTGAWYRLLERVGSAQAGDAAPITGMGVTVVFAGAEDHRRHSLHSTGDTSMLLKAYGTGDKTFMQLLPGKGGHGGRPASRGSSARHGDPGTASGRASSDKSGNSGLAADLQRILEERYGRALTEEEKREARRRVREHRAKGPKPKVTPSAASPDAKEAADATGDQSAATGQWMLPSLSGGGAASPTAAQPGRTGGRHSLDHTINFTEARRYDTAASALAASGVPHGDFHTPSNATGGVAGGSHDTGTSQSSLSPAEGATASAHRPHTAQSRPSTTSIGPHPNELSTTNFVEPSARPSTATAGRKGSTSADHRSQAGTGAAERVEADGTAARDPEGHSPSKSASGPVGADTSQSKPPAAQPPLELLTDSDNDEALDLFLAHFPESEEHVMLRKEANGILAGLPVLDRYELSSASDDEGLTEAEKEARRRRRQRQLYHKRNGAADEDESDEPPVGFDLDHTRLRQKFRTEADEEFDSLVAERDRLLAEVQAQRGTISDFHTDIYHLSKGKGGVVTGDKFAIQLTRDVNAYAKANHLRLNELDLSSGAHSMEEVAEGFLDHFGKEKTTRRNVATQVSDKDLGYADAGVRSAEAMLEDLVFHERGLMESIRLATVAIANIMSFHASLELESTCKECFYLFESPRTLWPCGHTFCQQCLGGMYNRNEELICAECGSLCEVGYTPNLSVELVANYQTMQDAAESPLNASVGTASVQSGRRHGTIEVVLRRLLNDLLTVQRNYTPGDAPTSVTTLT